jgi:hypothetical protein
VTDVWERSIESSGNHIFSLSLNVLKFNKETIYYDVHGSQTKLKILVSEIFKNLLLFNINRPTDQPIHSFIPWCRIYSEKLIVTQLVKE